MKWCPFSCRAILIAFIPMKFFTVVIICLIFAGLLLGATGFMYHKVTQQRKKVVQPVKKVEEVKITTIEGWTLKDISAYLEKQGLVKASDFEKQQYQVSAVDYPILNSVPAKQGLEGFLFPDTYRITKGSTSLDIIKRMLDNFNLKFAKMEVVVNKNKDRYVIPGFENLKLPDPITGVPTTGLSLYQVVTLASIVEKETGSVGDSAGSQRLLEERKTVAGIFYNRLSINQALESDATLNYVTGGGRAQATEQDLALNSPYNSYKYPGLPPGPIGNPSLSSLLAVINPIQSNYFFFLHKQPTGEVMYSKTFEEHVRKKQQYLR